MLIKRINLSSLANNFKSKPHKSTIYNNRYKSIHLNLTYQTNNLYSLKKDSKRNHPN